MDPALYDNLAGVAPKVLYALGAHFIQPPLQQPWGVTLAHFTDPSGNIWTLVSA